MIYVVTKGCYSDYHIITATIDKETAEKIAKKFSDKYDDAEVEEYGDAEIMLKNRWRVTFDPAGTVYRCEYCADRWYYEGDIERVGVCYDSGIVIYVEADSEEAAIKIAAEKRAKYLAEKLGL